MIKSIYGLHLPSGEGAYKLLHDVTLEQTVYSFEITGISPTTRQVMAVITASQNVTGWLGFCMNDNITVRAYGGTKSGVECVLEITHENGFYVLNQGGYTDAVLKHVFMENPTNVNLAQIKIVATGGLASGTRIRVYSKE